MKWPGEKVSFEAVPKNSWPDNTETGLSWFFNIIQLNSPYQQQYKECLWDPGKWQSSQIILNHHSIYEGQDIATARPKFRWDVTLCLMDWCPMLVITWDRLMVTKRSTVTDWHPWYTAALPQRCSQRDRSWCCRQILRPTTSANPERETRGRTTIAPTDCSRHHVNHHHHQYYCYHKWVWLKHCTDNKNNNKSGNKRLNTLQFFLFTGQVERLSRWLSGLNHC